MASEPVKLEPIRFGDECELDLRAFELRRAGRPLKLERIPMELLVLLIEQRGRLVTREQIVLRVWGKDVFLDADSSINAAIAKIRRALSDDPERPRFVQTVTSKGYRFIAPIAETVPPVSRQMPVIAKVSDIPAGADDAPVAAAFERPLATVAKSPANNYGRWLLGAGVALVAILSGTFQWFHSRPHRPPPSGRLMLAVLPFENLTGDSAQEYISDGMTEEMIAQLGRLDSQRLGVIARTSVMHYKHSQEPLPQIGRELGVQYVLEGSVRRDSGKVRITTQLVQMKDQTHLWSRQYDRELSSLLALQGEIAEEVAHEIQLTFDGRGRIDAAHQPPLSPKTSEAYELYLQGRYFWNQRTTQSLQQAVEHFQHAVEKDPGYARAYAAMAESYALMGSYNVLPPSEFVPKARAAALRALSIDDHLPEAHTALALIAQNYDWDWRTAEKEYRRAIQLDPNYATGHHWYAECLALQGRFDEAFPEIEIARRLDPLSLIIATDLGAILYFSRQNDRAIEQFRAVLEMEPNFPRAHMLVWADVQGRLFADALADAKKWQRRDDGPWSWVMLAYIHGRVGDHVQAQHALEKLRQLNQRGPLDPLCIAIAYIGMDNKDQAMDWLQKAYLEHASGLTALKVDPTYDPLRGDARFRALLHGVRLD
jgi:TolB-like protein/DNA-binding winged helix-turn-helix (wHTH) protein/Tfp pilus assembly protein PilF